MSPRYSSRFISIATVAKLASLSSALVTRSGSVISWAPCGNTTIPRECGTFQVPLDYTNASAGTASLAVVRINATVGPRLGTVFVNPGGPGSSGVAWVLNELTGEMAHVINGTGGQYDIVGWDPRGVGSSVPNVKCFDSGTEEGAFWNGSLRGTSLEIRTDFTNSTVREEFYSHIDEVDNTLVKFGKRCDAYNKGTLKYVGTASTVRDMVALHDYLEGTKEINYWGFSYGTIIGNYFINMFPDRVGRVVLDGVVNPWDWATKPPLQSIYNAINSSDATFDAFASTCITAGPSKCAIAQEGSTVESIREWAFNLIALAYDNTKAGGAVVTSARVRTDLWLYMYYPTLWPTLAQTLAQYAASLSNSTNSAGALKARGLPLQTYSMPFIRRDDTNTSDPATNYAYQAITCADAIDSNNTTRQMFETVVDITDNYTRMFGPSIGWNGGATYCHRWPARAVERFTGPFNHTLRNKIMVIGMRLTSRDYQVYRGSSKIYIYLRNTVDPVTPFSNAVAVAEALGDSAVLLKQNGYGHTSLFMHSSCTEATASKFFTTGELPPKGTVCETDVQLFP